jgi:hypothetical protein
VLPDHRTVTCADVRSLVPRHNIHTIRCFLFCVKGAKKYLGAPGDRYQARGLVEKWLKKAGAPPKKMWRLEVVSKPCLQRYNRRYEGV